MERLQAVKRAVNRMKYIGYRVLARHPTRYQRETRVFLGPLKRAVNVAVWDQVGMNLKWDDLWGIWAMGRRQRVIMMRHIGAQLYSWVWTHNITRDVPFILGWAADEPLGIIHNTTWIQIWLEPGNLRGIPRDCWNDEGIRLGYLNEAH